MNGLHRLHLDIGPLGDCCTDHSLEYMHKALADPPDGPVWEPHWDPFISGLIERFTHAGTGALLNLYNALIEVVHSIEVAHKAFRPDRLEVTQAIARLAGKSPRDYTVDDWMTLVDWLILRYLPEDFIASEAEFLAVRAAIAGRIKAHAPESAPGPNFETAVPTTIAGLVRRLDLMPAQQEMLRLARAHAGESIANIGEMTRHRIKQLVIQHLQDKAIGVKAATAGRLEAKLFEEFSILNRDWRRIALTETGNVTNEAVIAALPVGATVRRFEFYNGACEFCRKIDGMVFTVVDPNLPNKDGWTMIWQGKSNVGRSASPYRRENGELVKRGPEELWWPAAGLQHPNCRGGWVVIQSSGAAMRDDKTKDFVADLMRTHGLVVAKPPEPEVPARKRKPTKGN